MKIKVLSSGSKGNSTLVMTDNVKLLIDVGMNYQYIERELEKVGVSPLEITHILITHTHSDHVRGLKTFLKKTHIHVSIPHDMKEEMLEVVNEDLIDYIEDESVFTDLSVSLIHTSHDTSSSVGFIINDEKSSLVYVTDTGYINRKYLKKIGNKSVYIMESNHDEEMLMEGPYPYYLKQRVISDSGHLSNKMASKYLSTAVGEKTKYIILAHLSEKNNTEELALDALTKRLEDTCFNGKLLIARQNESLELIEV